MNSYRLSITVLLISAGITAPALADPLRMGRQMAESFLAGDVQTVWTTSTPEMQAAFGSTEVLTALRDSLTAGFGAEQAVLSERTTEQAGYDVYTRVSRWSQVAAPLELVISFDEAGRIAGFLARPQPVAAPSQYLDYQTQAELRLPFDGDWFVYWGGRDIEDNYHAIDPGQRFALDLLVLRDGKSHAGDPSVLENYHCWGQPILAPANGIVMRAVDGLPDQAIGASDPENPAGNHVVIDFGDEEFGYLAHLQQGSLRVGKGDPVTAGQEIGLCGNSGNTSEPHLHFHMQSNPRLGRGEGLPTQFMNYRADGELISRGEPQRGQVISPEK